MTALFSDTQLEAQAVLIDLLRKAPSWRKMEMIGELNTAARTLSLSGLRQRHPNADEAEIRRRLASLVLGDELATQIYGPLEFRDSSHEK